MLVLSRKFDQIIVINNIFFIKVLMFNKDKILIQIKSDFKIPEKWKSISDGGLIYVDYNDNYNLSKDSSKEEIHYFGCIGSCAKLGFNCTPEVSVWRHEIWEKLQIEK